MILLLEAGYTEKTTGLEMRRDEKTRQESMELLQTFHNNSAACEHTLRVNRMTPYVKTSKSDYSRKRKVG